MGRARAWLRLALMQKKLADYLKVLIDHKDEALIEYFEPDALMLSDEAIVIIGLLVGLNVIDCNLCVKVSNFLPTISDKKRMHTRLITTCNVVCFCCKGGRSRLSARCHRFFSVFAVFESSD